MQDYIVELNFQATGVTKDWSVGAWGESGEIEVTLPGRTSSSFPFLESDNSRLPINENGDPADDIETNETEEERMSESTHDENSEETTVTVSDRDPT